MEKEPKPKSGNNPDLNMTPEEAAEAREQNGLTAGLPDPRHDEGALNTAEKCWGPFEAPRDTSRE